MADALELEFDVGLDLDFKAPKNKNKNKNYRQRSKKIFERGCFVLSTKEGIKKKMEGRIEEKEKRRKIRTPRYPSPIYVNASLYKK